MKKQPPGPVGALGGRSKPVSMCSKRCGVLLWLAHGIANGVSKVNRWRPVSHFLSDNALAGPSPYDILISSLFFRFWYKVVTKIIVQ